MENFTVLIVDDEIENIDLLKVYLKKHYKSLNTVYTAGNVNEAIDQYMEHYPDILILDIELDNNTTCFQILENIPNTTAQIIFVTSHKDYAIQVINSVKTAAYLVKPVKPTDLIIALDKAVSNIETNNALSNSNIDKQTHYLDYIAIPSSNKIDIIHPKDIVYLQAEGRYTIFHLTNGNHKIASRNLGEYEKQLDPKLFFRIHHSYIVNLNMVININKSAGNYCELLNSKALPIAKRRQEKLHKFLKIK
ncbi:LytTR family DNA-binding domain-containing protein [Algibacter agarivorans]|uniref:LytTR family DNA-binding domain-containing protein n=1 Tax=Algibacter agarivorans TaxID=1109741 RepID=A0ABP9GBV6_9FLAO